MSMSRRTPLVLAGIVIFIVALGIYRASQSPPNAASETRATADSEVLLPTILDFGRGACIPCKQMMPVLETLAERHEGRIRVRYLDLARPANQERAAELRVRVIPTQVLLAADGAEVARHEGFWALDAIEAHLEELGWTPER
jgi:thioredoxin 1